MPRRSVVHIASEMMSQLSNNVWKVSAGEASWNDGFHSIQIRNCQMPRKIAMARSFGHVDFQILRPRDTFGTIGTSSASRPAVSVRSSTAMPADLLLEAVGDRASEVGDVEGVEAAGPLDVHRILLDDAAGPAREQDHA